MIQNASQVLNMELDSAPTMAASVDIHTSSALIQHQSYRDTHYLDSGPLCNRGPGISIQDFGFTMMVTVMK